MSNVYQYVISLENTSFGMKGHKNRTNNNPVAIRRSMQRSPDKMHHSV
jgi:hypothetical protein